MSRAYTSCPCGDQSLVCRPVARVQTSRSCADQSRCECLSMSDWSMYEGLVYACLRPVDLRVVTLLHFTRTGRSWSIQVRLISTVEQSRLAESGSDIRSSWVIASETSLHAFIYIKPKLKSASLQQRLLIPRRLSPTDIFWNMPHAATPLSLTKYSAVPED
jgi:hypothetical protein